MNFDYWIVLAFACAGVLIAVRGCRASAGPVAQQNRAEPEDSAASVVPGAPVARAPMTGAPMTRTPGARAPGGHAEAAAVLLAVLAVLLAIPCALGLRDALAASRDGQGAHAPLAPLVSGAASLWLALSALYFARRRGSPTEPGEPEVQGAPGPVSGALGAWGRARRTTGGSR